MWVCVCGEMSSVVSAPTASRTACVRAPRHRPTAAHVQPSRSSSAVYCLGESQCERVENPTRKNDEEIPSKSSRNHVLVPPNANPAKNNQSSQCPCSTSTLQSLLPQPGRDRFTASITSGGWTPRPRRRGCRTPHQSGSPPRRPPHSTHHPRSPRTRPPGQRTQPQPR